jgi:hypothetical protein
MLHRVITGAPAGLVVDHINGDTLDNRDENLRVCTHVQNLANARRNVKKGDTPKGVTYQKNTGKYLARLMSNGTRFNIGAYETAEAAGEAYMEAALRINGEFARIIPLSRQINQRRGIQ